MMLSRVEIESSLEDGDPLSMMGNLAVQQASDKAGISRRNQFAANGRGGTGFQITRE
jgi:hypothetical protein